MPDSYRDAFTNATASEHYERVIYGEGSASELLWEVERPILEALVSRSRRAAGKIRYLDFACGTGRVISFLEDKVDAATGIDISEQMLSHAAKRVRGATLICKDITAAGDDIEGQYELITAFRFLLNAEPDLRRAAMRQLVKRLSGPEARLVVNTHGNPFSHKALLLPYHGLKAALNRKGLRGYMSKREVAAVVAEAGLVVEQVVGQGFLSGRLINLFPKPTALAIERRLAAVPFLQPFGVNQLFVCRLPESDTDGGQGVQPSAPRH